MGHLPSRRYLMVLVVFFATLFVLSTLLLIKANGYQVLWTPFRLVKTGVISLDVHPPTQLQITLNGQLQPAGQLDFPNLTPGRYTIQVGRREFVTWEKTVELAGGQAHRLEDIVLFYAVVEPRTLDESELEVARQALDNITNFQAGLQILGNEIWVEDELVTRYSAPVDLALWLPGRTHLVALTGGAIHVLEATSEQDRVLIELSDGATAVRLVPVSGGSELIIDVDGQIAAYPITEPKTFLRLPSFQRTNTPVE